MFKIVVSTLFLLLISSECWARDLPSYFPTCCMKDPQLNKCLLKATKILQPRVAKGIPEISFPPLDPAVLPMLGLHQNTELLNYNSTLYNFTIVGMEQYDIKEIHYDPKTLRLHGTVQFPPVSLSSAYNVIGRILDFGIAGNGYFSAVLEPVNGTFEFLGKLVKRGSNNIDEEYYKPTEVNIKMTLPGFVVKLDGLFGSNEELGGLINNMINQNSNVIATAATPVLEEAIEHNLMIFMKLLTSKIPYNKLFPC